MRRSIVLSVKRALKGCFLLVLLSTPTFANEAIWIEGEDYTSSTFVEKTGAGPWYHNDKIMKDLLSPGEPGVREGDWHTHYTSNNRPDGIATYTFQVAEGGSYTWWIRLNPFRNKNGGADYSYNIDHDPWRDIDLSYVTNRIDLVDPGIDIRFIAWTFGGAVDLSQGSHTMKIRISDRNGVDEQSHGGIDAMAFTNFPWAPSGVVQPNPNPPAPGPGDWFMLMAGPDQYSPESIIDMSGLVGKPAGRHGFLEEKGKDFAFEDGTSVKFWGVDAEMTATVESQQRQVRFYVKHGINMVRQHPVEAVLGVLKPGPRGSRSFDADKLDRWDRWFSILKENGIYMTWSLFYPHVITPDDGYPQNLYNELPNKGAGKSTSGVVNMMKELQGAEWQWERTLLEHVNPYTGLAYKDDPALAIIEVHNEDCIFWHAPLNDLADYNNGRFDLHAAILGQMWMNWVKNHYGDDRGLAAAWGSGRRSDDSVDNPKMKMYGAWEMEADGPRWNKINERKRMGDFIRFLAGFQRGYYEQREQSLRDLGYKAVTVTTAWKAGGPAASAANLWADESMDAIDRHNYFGGGAGGHSITTGSVNNDTHLSKPGRGILSSGFWQVEDKPFIMTEWTQKPPNQWKAEMAPLFAFYGMGLQGWDASFHFAASRSYMGNGWPGMRSYVTCTPHYIGQFPALAFAIYNHHIEEGDTISARRLSTDEIFAGVDALGQKSGLAGYDENESLAQGETAAEALAIGRVTLKVEDSQGSSHLGDLSVYWDQRAKVVRSNTGQLAWDYGNKIVTVRSEKTQGVIGFAAGKTFDLPSVTVQVGPTPFISLLFTPLDNRPLIESEHILITAMARDKQQGAVYSDDGTELIECGGPPLLLEPVQATLTFKGGPLISVKVVDVCGVPTSREVERTGNTFSIDGRYATYYYEVKRQAK